MRKKSSIVPYFLISVIVHLAILLFLFQNKIKPDFMSAPIDVSFYSPSEVNANIQTTTIKQEEQEVQVSKKEEVITKEDVKVKAKEREAQKAKEQEKTKEQSKVKKTQLPTNDVKKKTPVKPVEERYVIEGAQFDGVAFDTKDFKFGYYAGTVVRIIGRNWQWAESYSKLRAVVFFKILKDGNVVSVSIKETSGNKSFDDNAIRAIKNSSPFAPLPQGYQKDSLGVYFEFKYKQ